MVFNPRAEAQARVGERYEARVLAPSPPAVDEGPWFADDPVAIGEHERPVVSPISTGDLSYEELAEGDEEFAAWCAERWLGCYRRLEPLAPGFAATRAALHRVAEEVLKPARQHATTKFGLRYTFGGFGTPFFRLEQQLRVEGATLIHQRGEQVTQEPITTLAAAASFAGVEIERDLVLNPDPAAAAQLGELFGFAASVLEELRGRAGAELEASRVQIWPEHFDMAVEIGSEQRDARAAYGISPGDETHPEPYAYVAPWTARPSGELWQAEGFPGAALSWAELLDAPDQRAAALEFFAARIAALNH